MIRHLLKIVWRRKRANALVIAEIFFSFLVLVLVLTAAIAILARWNEPLGFAWRDVWVVAIDGMSPDMADEPEFRASMTRVLAEVKAMPEVVDAALGMHPPYSQTASTGRWRTGGKSIDLTRDWVTDDYAKVLQMKVVRGRWFEPADDASSVVPVVIDSDLARELYGSSDPVGQKFDSYGDFVFRVVGVVPPYRKNGELSSPNVNMAFYRTSLALKGPAPRSMLVRVRPGTTGEFEQTIAKRIQAVDPTLSFSVRRMESMRTMMIRMILAPVAVLGLVGLFLIAMVALGLTGVIWQSVTRRTRELGLRRAVGATGSSVRTQVLLEVVLISTIAVAAGVAIVLQLPVMGLLQLVSLNIFAAAVASALVVIYAITLLCAAYPSWLASRVEPADALRYE